MTAKKTEWSVRLELAGDPDEDRLDAVADAIERYAGIVGGGTAGTSFGIRLTVKARSSVEGVQAAEAIVRKALARAGVVAGPIVSHEVHTMDVVIARNLGATADTLVGLSDIARMHQFSRQRALELANHPLFPKPAATVASGRVWRLVDVERFLATPRAPGRPRRNEARVC
jgi:hypothetical protein